MVRDQPTSLHRAELSSTARLRPSRTAWSDLSTKLREFSRVCIIDQTAPDLIIGFTRTERLFEDFSRRAMVTFNDACQMVRSAESHLSLSMRRAADSLLEEWQNFAANFLAVLNHGATPLYPMMADRLGGLARVLQLLSGMFADPRPLVAIGLIRRTKVVIDGLRSDVDRLSAAACMDGELGFDLVRLRRLDAQVRLLFSEAVPKNCFIIGGLAAAKRDLLRAADVVIAVADAIAGFDRCSWEVTDALLVMDEAMADLFADLGIIRSPRQDIAHKVFDTSEKAASAAQCCDKIRARIAQIERVLSDTSKLYIPKT
jgi:hypothetical protein